MAMHLTDRVRRELMRPFSLEGDDDFFTDGSIGVALSGARRGAAELVRDADAAMYRAKATGGATAELFDSACATRPSSACATERALRRGLRAASCACTTSHLVARDRRVEAVEALARWARPGHGLVSPAGFIGVAEESGLMTCRRRVGAERGVPPARRVARRAGDAAPLPVHVNVSSRELEQPASRASWRARSPTPASIPPTSASRSPRRAARAHAAPAVAARRDQGDSACGSRWTTSAPATRR